MAMNILTVLAFHAEQKFLPLRLRGKLFNILFYYILPKNDVIKKQNLGKNYESI